MDEETFSELELKSRRKLAEAKKFAKHRYLFEILSKASGKFYHGIYGIRGVGKTVLLLQLAELAKNPLYVPADAAYLRRYDIYEIVSHAVAKGYSEIYIDEIHTKSNWKADLKTLYDEGDAKIFFTGSSSIKIQEGADLSRRAMLYELKPTSFREYLNIKKGAEIRSVSLEELENEEKRREIAYMLSKWSAYLGEYYMYGGVLYEDVEKEYPKTILSVVEKMLAVDLPTIRKVDAGTIDSLYKLLYKIAISGPYEASYSNIASYLGVSKATAKSLVEDLEKMGLVIGLQPCGGEFRKEPKLFFTIPFRSALCKSIGAKPDLGALREEFFVNSTNAECYFKTKRGAKTPDFLLGGKVIEVGGEHRKSASVDYVAIDGLNYQGNAIPLFLFGMLY